jgi:hypothetical protein
MWPCYVVLHLSARRCLSGFARFFSLQHTKMEKSRPNNQEINQVSINMANVRKYIYQMDIKCTSIFYCKTLQNLPKFGFLVWKYTIWQPWFWLRLWCGEAETLTPSQLSKKWVEQIFVHPRFFSAIISKQLFYRTLTVAAQWQFMHYICKLFAIKTPYVSCTFLSHKLCIIMWLCLKVFFIL